MLYRFEPALVIVLMTDWEAYKRVDRVTFSCSRQVFTERRRHRETSLGSRLSGATWRQTDTSTARRQLQTDACLSSL